MTNMSDSNLSVVMCRSWCYCNSCRIHLFSGGKNVNEMSQMFTHLAVYLAFVCLLNGDHVYLLQRAGISTQYIVRESTEEHLGLRFTSVLTQHEHDLSLEPAPVLELDGPLEHCDLIFYAMGNA